MKKVLSLLVLSLCTALVALADGTVSSFATVGEGVTLVSATNDAAYPWDDTIVAGAITSTNKNHGSASAYVLNIESTSAIYVKLAYSVSSENNCDFLRILDGTTELYSFSGSSSNQTLEFLLKAGSHALTFKYTKDYLVATEEELAKTTDMKEFFYNMCMRFPESVLIFLSNDMNSSVFLGGREWNWSDLTDDD